MNHTGVPIRTEDGINLNMQIWNPDIAPRGVLAIVHGMGEHSGRYTHLADVFLPAGLAITAFDLRGHGKSGGVRGHAPSFESFMDDIALFLQKTATEFPGVPRILFGHSLGGLLVLNYTLRRAPNIHGVIASAPALKSPVADQKLKVLLAKLGGSLFPSLTMASGLNPEHISRDPLVVKKYLNDPLVHDRSTLAMAKNTVEAMPWALDHAHEFCVPLLIMHGDADALCLLPGSQKFISQVTENSILKVWPGLHHELHNEPEQAEVFAYMLTWINQQI